MKGNLKNPLNVSQVSLLSDPGSNCGSGRLTKLSGRVGKPLACPRTLVIVISSADFIKCYRGPPTLLTIIISPEGSSKLVILGA